jgi:phospholipid transport system substrate-binding protein
MSCAKRARWTRNGLTLGLSLLLLGTAIAAGTDDTPTATVRRLLEALHGYRTAGPGPSTADQQHNTQVLRVARESLGIRTLAMRTLGTHWNALSERQRNEFVDLLNALLERKAYPKSATFFGDLRVDYLGETVSGERSTVRTRVVHPKEGEIGIDYVLERTAGRWLIVDVLLDDVSLATDIRTQVQRIISDQSYAELIRRMREKLSES